MKLSTRRLAVIGMLGAVSIVLGLTPLGLIPIGPLKATIMHIPVIIGSIMEGPIVGLFIGLIFGGVSMFQAYVMPTNPVQVVFMDPVVAILPRLLIALVSYYSYQGVKGVLRGLGKQKRGVMVGTMVAAAAGTLTNTTGVLGAIYLRHAAVYAEKLHIDPSIVGKTIFGFAITNGIPEAIVAVLVVTAVVRALQKIYKQEF